MMVNIHPLRLTKAEKLCSRTAVNALFSDGHSAIAYPLRAVYRLLPSQEGAPLCRMLITIPKKKMRHAVDRVLLRRRVREAYRLRRNDLLLAPIENCGCRVDVAFVFLANRKAPYELLEKKMAELLQRIARQANSYVQETR